MQLPVLSSVVQSGLFVASLLLSGLSYVSPVLVALIAGIPPLIRALKL